MKRIKALVATVKDKLTVENWTFFLLVVGLPLIGYIYTDWKLALTIFCIVNIVIGILYIRKHK